MSNITISIVKKEKGESESRSRHRCTAQEPDL